MDAVGGVDLPQQEGLPINQPLMLGGFTSLLTSGTGEIKTHVPGGLISLIDAGMGEIEPPVPVAGVGKIEQHVRGGSTSLLNACMRGSESLSLYPATPAIVRSVRRFGIDAGKEVATSLQISEEDGRRVPDLFTGESIDLDGKYLYDARSPDNMKKSSNESSDPDLPALFGEKDDTRGGGEGMEPSKKPRKKKKRRKIRAKVLKEGNKVKNLNPITPKAVPPNPFKKRRRNQANNSDKIGNGVRSVRQKLNFEPEDLAAQQDLRGGSKCNQDITGYQIGTESSNHLLNKVQSESTSLPVGLSSITGCFTRAVLKQNLRVLMISIHKSNQHPWETPKRRRKEDQECDHHQHTLIDSFSDGLRILSTSGISQVPDDISQMPEDLKSRALVPYVCPTEDIVCAPKDTAAFGLQSALVAYTSLYVEAKKRRVHAKVDLDEETIRVWNLLTGRAAIEGADVGEGTRWDEERRLFFGRADAFIARMRLFQGERKFSPWKGSVVDSVVGVFLTQNVSDNLSSSAFMTLASKFLPWSKEDNNTNTDSFGRTSSCGIISNLDAKDLNVKPIENEDPQDISESSLKLLKDASGLLNPAANLVQSIPESNPEADHQLHCNGLAGFDIHGNQSSSGSSDYGQKMMNVGISRNVSTDSTANDPSVKKADAVTEKAQGFDWDGLRKEACFNGYRNQRNAERNDSVDWEAVRCSHVDVIAEAIKERGQHNLLAARIKDFLNRLVRDHGSIDLEWLRDVPPDRAKEYLLSIRGLGVKSVDCVRLLTLHHVAFPVDTNVARICTRLGWVQLQALPDFLQFHLVEEYPIMADVQKYLWPRLCTLDQKTLYELHYQMITFGKVFCTKNNPNCNACPMKGDCKYFSSALASTRAMLPSPEQKSTVSSIVPVESQYGNIPSFPVMLPIYQLEGCNTSRALKNLEPIIEEPTSPEPEPPETLEYEANEIYCEDMEDIPTIKLSVEVPVDHNCRENNAELQGGDYANALVVLPPEAGSIPAPKIKNINRLRTEHLAYELPDNHPLLEGRDQREVDDPCRYLLIIRIEGEDSQSAQPLDIVRGTILIPCRTATRGRFPLNGTYFQVNEVFADHASSINPIVVSRESIWNLPMRIIYFGTSVQTIFRGLTREAIHHCFWEGYVCVRGFDSATRAPRPLHPHLHVPLSKMPKNNKSSTKEEK